MAVRVTSATALSVIRQFGADLSKWVGEAGPLSAAPRLRGQLDEWQDALAGPVFPIEVWLDDGTPAEEASRWLLGDAAPHQEQSPDGVILAEGAVGTRRVRLTFATSAQPFQFSVGQLAPSLLVWMRQHETATGGETPSLEDRAMVVATSAGPGLQDAVIVSRGAPDGVIERLFASPVLSQGPDLLRADAGARALEALAAIAGLAFDQEARAIRAKRALAQQRAATVQSRQPSSSQGEGFAALKSRLQRTFGDLVRGIDDRFTSAFAPGSPFWTGLEEQLTAIETLDFEPRVKTVVTRLPAEAEEAWLQGLRTGIRQHCLADLGALRDTLRASGNEIEKTLNDAGGPPLVVQFQHIAEDRLARVLDTHVLSQRKYQGEMAKRGMFEYLTMARRYQTVAFMLLSAFGLSFLRTYREFMVPAAIVLLSLGGLQVVHSVGRERAETLAKELDKVRELLRAESRRILSDVQRSWSALISQHLSDQLPNVLGQVDLTLRDFANRLAAEGADERQRLQRQLQAFEAAERKLAAPIKAREGVAQGVAQVRGELRQLIAAATRGATV